MKERGLCKGRASSVPHHACPLLRSTSTVHTEWLQSPTPNCWRRPRRRLLRPVWKLQQQPALAITSLHLLGAESLPCLGRQQRHQCRI